jgi:hypothetical protein
MTSDAFKERTLQAAKENHEEIFAKNSLLTKVDRITSPIKGGGPLLGYGVDGEKMRLDGGLLGQMDRRAREKQELLKGILSPHTVEPLSQELMMQLYALLII